MTPLTRKELDRHPCAHPNCDHTSHSGPMTIRPACHPHAALCSSYQTGILTLSCKACMRTVSAFEVARLPAPSQRSTVEEYLFLTAALFRLRELGSLSQNAEAEIANLHHVLWERLSKSEMDEVELGIEAMKREID